MSASVALWFLARADKIWFQRLVGIAPAGGAKRVDYNLADADVAPNALADDVAATVKAERIHEVIMEEPRSLTGVLVSPRLRPAQNIVEIE